MFCNAYATYMAILHGFKLSHHFHEFLPRCVKLGVSLDLLSPVKHLFPGASEVNFYVLLDSPANFFSLLVYGVNLHCRF